VSPLNVSSKRSIFNPPSGIVDRSGGASSVASARSPSSPAGVGGVPFAASARALRRVACARDAHAHRPSLGVHRPRASAVTVEAAAAAQPIRIVASRVPWTHARAKRRRRRDVIMVNARVERRCRATRERKTSRRRGVRPEYKTDKSRRLPSHRPPTPSRFRVPGGGDGDDDDDDDDDDAHRSRRRFVVARGESETFFDFDTEKRDSAQPDDGATRDDER
jgi:hypothetical protein